MAKVGCVWRGQNRPMPTPAAPTSLLHLLWLASPALPVGGFSYSEGLEAAVDAGVVHDETSAGDWLLNQLELVQARAELPIAAAAHAATLALDGARLAELNAWVLQTRETSESLQQVQQIGARPFRQLPDRARLYGDVLGFRDIFQHGHRVAG